MVIRRLLRCRKGSVAIETAFVIPVLITMFLGMIELTMFIEATRKAVSATQTVADLVAQEATHDDESLADIRAAADIILNPLPTDSNTLQITIASVGFDQSGNTRILWQDKSAGGAAINPAVGNGLGSPNESVVVVLMTYTYSSPFDFIFESKNLAEEAFARPRVARRIALNGSVEH
ncbi:TadE/TadG family type IV pilus assembly protein [Roseospira goensis]|uniref:Flp pilus assembly protein TadG n=1 Tax=Roseospira goensis TaxID=391922 RepID=A0A7W6S1N6_9PROT|nr:TadE/TadG family type IV pilus assembly protein [Roseospira goensis]MBB4287081.1 Flp pilus assembly protein TadG [Roseospira goensis]